MARRKSVCVKWTVALVLVLFSSFVFSRPQELHTTSELEETTENTIRYRRNEINIKLPLFSYSESISFADKVSINVGMDINNQKDINELINDFNETEDYSNNRNKRETQIDNIFSSKSLTNRHPRASSVSNKPIIKKIVTKWTDNVKNLDLSHDDIGSKENGLKNKYASNEYSDEYDSKEGRPSGIIVNRPNKNRVPNRYNRPQSQYSDEQFYTSNLQMTGDHPYSYTRPSYVYTTASPTPIITNVGYPRPWQQNNLQIIKKPNKPRPTKPTRPDNNYNQNNLYHHSPYPGNFEVTTFQPSPTYTDRIVIRPEEYAADSEDCPTIFMTLNNTFQGEGKEACPDLHIAVNTNVINKNNVVESEENNEAAFTDIFGLPSEESGSEENANDNEYSASDENEEESESASIEGLSLPIYNSDNEESGDNFGSPSNALSEIKRPNRPSKKKNELIDYDSVFDYIQPLIGGFSWLAAINPFSFSAVSFLLTPIILVVAAVSGFIALFSPFSYGREAPQTPIEYPSWQLEDYYKSWYYNSLADRRRWQQDSPRTFLDSNNNTLTQNTKLLDGIKEFLKAIIVKVNDKNKSVIQNKRKKRETWMIRVK